VISESRAGNPANLSEIRQSLHRSSRVVVGRYRAFSAANRYPDATLRVDPSDPAFHRQAPPFTTRPEKDMLTAWSCFFPATLNPLRATGDTLDVADHFYIPEREEAMVDYCEMPFFDEVTRYPARPR
jgi:hypothetical protein